jgi:predicted amidohydrolase YtcJ
MSTGARLASPIAIPVFDATPRFEERMTPGRRPLLLVLNGVIHTMDPDQPRADAIAIDRTSGRILAVGDTPQMRALSGPLTETLDLRGRTVLPGFIDAHTHLMGYAQSRLDVDLRTARSEDEAVERVRSRAERTPPGAWILGQSWDQSVWPGQRFPTRAALDAAVPDHPVALASYDHHSLWVNAAALRLAGIDAQTPDPRPGRIGRDEHGEPDGMLYEDATNLVHRVAQPDSDERVLAELRTVFAELAARGVTGVHNIEDDRSLRLMQRMRAKGELAPRVLYYIRRGNLPQALALGIQADFGDDLLRFAGIKVFMDGALGSRTAAMLDPYEGQPENRGLLTTTADETERLVRDAAGGGIGVAIHAIGDRAVHAALDGIEAALRCDAKLAEETGKPTAARRFRLEHVQLATPSDIERMARLGVAGSVQPFHAVHDRPAALRHWGERAKRGYAYQTMRAAGIPLALGSDVPVDTPDPLRILHAALTRRNDAEPDDPAYLPEQALTIAQALWAYTMGAAYAGGQETRQGSITPGKLADLVVLVEDPFAVPPERIAGAEVAATFVGGEMVHGELE